jgi:hypothetical protein
VDYYQHRYITEAEVKVIVNEIVSRKFEDLQESVNKAKGAIWAVGGILTVIEIYSLLAKGH